MLKTRVIPILTIKDLRLVKSVQFAEHRNIGSYIAAVRVFNSRDVDEMAILDLDGNAAGIKPQLIEEITKECFMPLTVGGGIKTLGDIQTLLGVGADKVSINTAVLLRPEFISEAAERFGSQAVVISVDTKKTTDGYKVFSHNGSQETVWAPDQWACEAQKRGAGEILLTSIDHDGMMDGYDLELVRFVSSVVDIPVIAAGGAGNPEHCIDVIQIGKASAVAATSIFQYTQITPRSIKEHLLKAGIEARV